MKPASSGFILIEALIAIAILAVAFTAFIGVIAQAMRVSTMAQRAFATTNLYDELLFESQNGFRDDIEPGKLAQEIRAS